MTSTTPTAKQAHLAEYAAQVPEGFITGTLENGDVKLFTEKTAGGRHRVIAQEGTTKTRMTKDGKRLEAFAALVVLTARRDELAEQVAKAAEQLAARVKDAAAKQVAAAKRKPSEKAKGKAGTRTPARQPRKTAAKPAPAQPEQPQPEQPQLTVEQVAAKLPAALVRYAEAHSTTDPDAGPLEGLPFINLGRLYLALNGKPGLVEYLDGNGELAGLGKRVVSAAVQHLGATRQPVSYKHPTKGTTSAGYWWLPLSAVGEVHAEARQPQRQAKQAATAAGSVGAPVPMMPAGDDKDSKQLRKLWDEYNAARETYKKSHGKKVSDEKRAEYQASMREAHAELVAHRTMMQTKLDRAEATTPTA
jgi:hypothetical protein